MLKQEKIVRKERQRGADMDSQHFIGPSHLDYSGELCRKVRREIVKFSLKRQG